MSGKPWTGAEVKRLKEMVSLGLENKLIAFRMGRTNQSIQAACKRFKCQRYTRAQRCWTADKIAQLKRLWEAGVWTGDIAGEMGWSKTAIATKAAELGLPRRPRGGDRSPNARALAKKRARAYIVA